jgi:hypothetical protein
MSNDALSCYAETSAKTSHILYSNSTPRTRIRQSRKRDDRVKEYNLDSYSPRPDEKNISFFFRLRHVSIEKINTVVRGEHSRCDRILKLDVA